MLKIGDRVRCIDSAGSRWLRERPNAVFVVVSINNDAHEILDVAGTINVIVEGDPANRSNRLFMRRFVVIEEEKGLKVGDRVRYLKRGCALRKEDLAIVTHVAGNGMIKVRKPGARKELQYWYSQESFKKLPGVGGQNPQPAAIVQEPPKKLAVQWEPGVDNMPADQVPAILKELNKDFEAGQYIGTCSYLIEYREGGFKKQYADVCHARIPTPRAKNVALRVKEHAKDMREAGGLGLNWDENEAIQYVKDWTSYIITESPVRDVFVKTTIDDAMEYGLLMNNKYHERVVSMAAIMWRVGVEHKGFIETWREMRQRGYSGAVSHLTAHFCYKANGVYTPFSPAGWHNSMESQMDFDELMDRFSGRNLVFNTDPPLHVNGNPGGRINVNLAKDAKQRGNRIIDKIVDLFPENQVERPGFGHPYLKEINLRDVVKIATFFKETLYGGDAAKAILAFDEIDR